MANEQPLGLRVYTEPVTAAANIPAKTLVTAAGAVPANAAAAYGVVANDVANGEVADVITVGLVPVIATGAVTKGASVEALQAATFVTKDSAGVANVTGAGVQDFAAGVKIGRAHSTGVAGDVVLIEMFGHQV
jgi:hypothetical protein